MTMTMNQNDAKLMLIFCQNVFVFCLNFFLITVVFSSYFLLANVQLANYYKMYAILACLLILHLYISFQFRLAIS